MQARIHTLIAAALAASLAAGCGGHAGGPRGTTASPTADGSAALLAAADVAVARRADLTAGVPVSGTLTPGWEARVTSPFDDQIAEVYVKEGQRVARGQPLARFRSDALEPAAASAAAQLKSASADYERQKNLFAEGAVSQRDVEAAEAAWRAAQAANAQAARRLADATLRAPAAGVVTRRVAQTGDRVGSGDPLFTVSDTRTLEFEATVPSEFVRILRPGQPVALDVSGFPAGAIRGRIARINATADPATRQLQLYVSVPNGDGRLVGGLFASGRVLTTEVRGALAVPSAAVRREGDSTVVWLVRDGRLARRTVRAGVLDEADDLVEILGGLAAGDVVVTGPVEGLSAGQLVHVAGRES